MIRNGNIWDGCNFFAADVFIREGKVHRIGKNIKENADFTYDAVGKIVSPGLVDLHAHIKGFSPEEFATCAEMACFPFGVTAINDAGSVSGNKETSDKLFVKNTIFLRVEIKDNHVDYKHIEERLEHYGDKAIGLKLYMDTYISEVSDITPLKECCEYARMKKLKVMVHCSNSPVPMREIVEILSEGDILTHAYHGGIHSCVEDDFCCLQLAKERGVVIDAGFAGHIHTNFRYLEQAIQLGYGPEVIGTDITQRSIYQRGGRYGMTMCMSMARRAGMKEEDIWKAVTMNPAHALGKGDQWGTLKEGRCADITVIDPLGKDGFRLLNGAGNCLEDDHGYRCVLTISDGQVVYRD